MSRQRNGLAPHRLRGAAGLGLCVALLAGCVGSAPSVSDRTVVIKRDSHGVPHVYAKDTYGLFHGFGYAVAEDRLYQLEMAKRSGNGSVAEVLGPSYVATDTTTRSNIDPASIRRQLDALGADDRAMFEGYAAGVNARIRDVLADRGKLLPRQFIDNGFLPVDWTADDVALVWIGLILNRFFAGTAELGNLTLLQQLQAARGDAAGQALYEQMRWLEDPTAPTIVPRGTGRASVARRGAGAGRLAPVSAQAAADFQAAQAVRLGLEAAQQMPTASNAMVLAPQRTREGAAVLYNGPQQGFNNPSFVHGIGLHGAGYDLTGATPVGLPAVLFGTNGRIAWGSTVGSLDTNDLYQEALNPANRYEYRYQGAYRPMALRTDEIRVKGEAPRRIDIYATVHGFVQSWDLANGRAYTLRSSWQGREVETLLGWAQAARARDWPQFLAQGARVSASITWFYADVAGNIGAVGLGSLPQRPAGQDIRFPARGDGSMEWQGLLPFSANPRSYNPGQGYLASWNNQIAEGLRADGANFSHVDRVAELHAQLRDAGPLSAEDIWKVAENGALADLNARYFVPLIAHAAAGLPADAPARRAADLLSRWDFRNRAAGEIYDNNATTVLRAWLDAMVQRLLADDLPPAVLAGYIGLGYPNLTARGSPGSVQPAAAAKLIWNALSGPAVGVPQRFDFLNGQEPQALVRAALDDAVNGLTQRLGPDMARWTTPVVRHRFASSNAIGVPWAGADEQPELPLYLNRGTLNYRVVLRPGAVQMCSVAAPGQSGFVGPDGRRDRHYGDQLALFRDFGCKPERLTLAEVDADLDSTRTLRY
ncbi:penicillin acylase family protein [Comamonas thiooxydans]|uniref:Penicillin acylase family protein n=1 Tax=Comamonas thiooxydans TaxID=363952 RepID=A0AA42Q0T2_9BURK|nr:penicillin acylase family protein [Comamonas thiooxydans]MDH1332753.1 penicillin acylase family protein [Comamonas thiooxydans]MDH1739765.1 penicillin acylase family protein [Comamonas thiooxydans]MDH1785180.1 penicillin acylase family protein [Comamonas thiooxydans]